MTAECNASLLRDILGLGPTGNTADHDAVLVAVDFENIDGLVTAERKEAAKGQMGVAILDTRELYASPGDSIISTLNFAVGSPKYIVAAQKKFIFGKTLAVQPGDLASLLRELIPTSRKMVLVAHDVLNELRALRHLDVNVDMFNGHLDTLKLSYSILPKLQRRTLGHLLEHLAIPYERLHCAGNDAHFTLQCLLILGTKSFQQHSEALEHKIRVLRKISASCLPNQKSLRRLEKKARRKTRALMKRLQDFTTKIGEPSSKKEKSEGKKGKRRDLAKKLEQDYGGSFVRKHDSATQIRLRDERAARRAAEKDAEL